MTRIDICGFLLYYFYVREIVPLARAMELFEEKEAYL
jgi:hypothetical protein